MSLIQIRPHRDLILVSRGRSVLCLNNKGFIESGPDGMFVLQARILSKLRFLIDGNPCQLMTGSNIEQNTWLGYFVQPSQLCNQHSLLDVAEQTIELKVSIIVGPGLHINLQLTNFMKWNNAFQFGLELDADFADLGYYAVAPGMLVASSFDQDKSALTFNARAEHQFAYPGYEGHARFSRSCEIHVRQSQSKAERTDYGLGFNVSIDPGQTWNACLDVSGKERGADFESPPQASASKTSDGTAIEIPGTYSYGQHLIEALRRSKDDLGSLEMGAEATNSATSPGSQNKTVVAGVPKYTSLFGRDSLKTSWHSSLLGYEHMKDSLRSVAAYQGTVWNDWTDERPGRMPHEVQTGPLACLRYKPSFRNYGSVTASSVFCIVLTEMWRWSGDDQLAQALLGNAMKAMADLDKNDLQGDGIYQYKTRSPQGVKNQAWKDSPNAIVYPDGSIVDAPIGTCDQQGYIYLAKENLAELLDWFGHKSDAKRMRKEAAELKKRFNDKFWIDTEQFIALGLDPELKQIQSITSDPGHCLATGIVDEAVAPAVIERLMAPDLFSGWGVRTLSTKNPAYNPWSYHRGSVWPVEQATFCLGFKRYAQRAAALKLLESQLDALSLFPHMRFPELFAGHARDDEHPFPAIYPDACWPQAWSASAPIMLLHVLLGTYAYAPKQLLFVDPCLPEWLPEIKLEKLRVGQATVSLRVFQTKKGCGVEILSLQGKLKVIHEPLVWSNITRIKDIGDVA